MPKPSAPPPGSIEFGGPVARSHASDHVFRDIAGAILRRDLQPGTTLPPERELSERFGVSRIVVREAIHRLKDYELLRVRQGSPTIVLDPDDSGDIRLLGLEIEVASDQEDIATKVIERQRLAAVSLVAVAQYRATDAELNELSSLAERYLKATAEEDLISDYERPFWLMLGRATRNPLLLRETQWAFNTLLAQPELRARWFDQAHPERAIFYQLLVRKLLARQGAAEFFMETMLRSIGEEIPAPAAL